MENRIFLQRYRLSVSLNGLPVELHRGPTARTFRAQEIASGREVALTLAPAPNDLDLLARLEEKASAAKKVSQSSIPRLLDFGREEDDLIYVTEYVEGHTAAAWLAARGPLSIGPVLRLAVQVTEAMNAAAFQRLHHPALNPENILFVAGQTAEDDWPAIKVLNWFVPPPSFSGADDAPIERAARFAAPEQLDGGAVDVRSEIYALGATIWFLLTGAPPALAATGKSFALAQEKLRGVPKIARHLLNRMLRAEPAERPQDPVALASYLQTCLGRVDRREKIERQLRLPLFVRPRIWHGRPLPIPLKALASVVAFLVLAAAAIIFLPWPLRSQRPAVASAPPTPLVPKNMPNEMPIVLKDSLGRIDALEAAPPAEGPSATAEQTEAPAVTVQTNEPVPGPTVGEERRDFVANATPAPEKRENPLTKTRAKKESVVARSRKSSSHAGNHQHRTNHHRAVLARRAQPLPKLRVGSAPAELVGTTSDGRWILSVSESGRRVIVPPPPGY
ncbi:MAG TPA: protein kinase [Chthoniobacterales bacterium]